MTEMGNVAATKRGRSTGRARLDEDALRVVFSVRPWLRKDPAMQLQMAKHGIDPELFKASGGARRFARRDGRDSLHVWRHILRAPPTASLTDGEELQCWTDDQAVFYELAERLDSVGALRNAGNEIAPGLLKLPADRAEAEAGESKPLDDAYARGQREKLAYLDPVYIEYLGVLLSARQRWPSLSFEKLSRRVERVATVKRIRERRDRYWLRRPGTPRPR